MCFQMRYYIYIWMFIYNAKDGDSYPFLVPTFLWTLKNLSPISKTISEFGLYFNDLLQWYSKAAGSIDYMVKQLNLYFILLFFWKRSSTVEWLCMISVSFKTGEIIMWLRIYLAIMGNNNETTAFIFQISLKRLCECACVYMQNKHYYF